MWAAGLSRDSRGEALRVVMLTLGKMLRKFPEAPSDLLELLTVLAFVRLSDVAEGLCAVAGIGEQSTNRGTFSRGVVVGDDGHH